VPLSHDSARITAWAERLTAALEAQHAFQQIAVLIHDSEAHGLRLVTQRWAGGGDLGLLVPGEWVVPLEGSVCGRVFRSGVPALCSDISLDPDYLSFAGGRTKSELAVPIIVGDQTVGVVNLEAPWVSAFGIADLELVQRLIDEAVVDFPVRTGNGAG
jgi:GAF domain-containing protein